MSVFKNQAKKAAHSQRVPLVSNVTIHSIHYSSILAHGPGTPFTLQEYFGFHLSRIRPLPLSEERGYNKLVSVGGIFYD